MTTEEAFNLVSNVSPCWDCRYKNSSCNRQTAHVWADGICHDFDEAIQILSAILFPNEPEPESEPEP